jgi:predicted nucleic acid-binding protein
MSYLIDTSFAIDLFTNQRTARDLLPARRSDGFALTIFTYMELWEGVAECGQDS